MPTIDDLATFYDVANGEGELVTLNGQNVAAIFETQAEVVLGDAVVQAPALRLPSATVAERAAGEGSTCIARGGSYIVRKVLALPPDGAESLLVLAAV